MTYRNDSEGDKPTLNQSIAKILLSQTPAHAWQKHPRLNPDYKETHKREFDLGTAAHAVLFEGWNKIAICDFADWRTKLAQEAKELAYSQGKTPLLAKEAERVKAMTDAARKAWRDCSDLEGYALEDGDVERAIYWVESFKDANGTNYADCRARLDWLSRDMSLIVDYKTTDNCKPEKFIRKIGDFGYDVQVDFYTRAVRSLWAEESYRETKFVFMVQETEAPFACSFVALSPAFLALAKNKVDKALAIWARCLRDNRWPGYESRIHCVDPTPWMIAEGEM